MKSRSSFALGVVFASSFHCGSSFHRPGLPMIHQQAHQRKHSGAFSGSSILPGSKRRTVTSGSGSSGSSSSSSSSSSSRLYAKAADPPSSSAAPGKDKGKEGEEQKSSDKKRRRKPRGNDAGSKAMVKQVVQAWADDSLDLRRFQGRRIHICEAETLPEVLSEFWTLASELAQEKYSAMASNRDSHAAHTLFVVTRCGLLKDYKIMRHLDKVLDFCAGGCSDFGRTVTLQHYHPDFVLPPSRTRSADDANSKGLARFINFSRSPYPMFGLTASAGSVVRSDPINASDKIARIRSDLELVYNSVAGPSTDDSVDSHGSPHGTIPSSAEEVEDKTLDWLFGLPSASSSAALGEKKKTAFAEKQGERAQGGVSVDGGEEGGQHQEYRANTAPGSSYLTSSYEGGLMTSNLNTPEKVLSEVWSIVTQLQEEAAPLLATARQTKKTTLSPPTPPSSSLSSSATSPSSPSGKAETFSTAAAVASPAPAPALAPAVSAAAAAVAAAAAAAVAAAEAAAEAMEQWTSAASAAASTHHGESKAEENEARHEGADKQQVEEVVETEVREVEERLLASTMLVTPRLHPFNAAQFDNFARNLAIALKQAPIIDKIEIEVYHPELVCEGGIVDLERRSPYPTLLLKHCGLKDVLFDPSGKFRHDLPALRLPVEDVPEQEKMDSTTDGVDNGHNTSASDDNGQSSATPEPADDAQL